MRKNPLSNMSVHGGIISSELLQNLRKENVNDPAVLPDSFAAFEGAPPPNRRELDQQIAEVWDDLLERWDSISSRYLRMDVSEARSKWIMPLLRSLGFEPIYSKQDILIGEDEELKFRLSHRGWDDPKAPIVHTVAPSQDLEQKLADEVPSGRRERKRSPHDELQTYLNLNKASKWGIVTNGIILRILRDFYHTTTKGYAEFDIENIFRERSFTDFRVLYRLAHASRFLPDNEGICLLEHFYKESVATGIAIGESLRKNVKRAIEALGNGFLTNELAEKMVEDTELCRKYYSEILVIIYRMLFLLFAEQRAMLPTRDSLYADEYSMNRLREISESIKSNDGHCDLWEGLKVTFHFLKNGCAELGVFGYNGSLFDDSEIPIISNLTCKNLEILAAVRNLTVVEEERVLRRINYLDLGVEELGSIYESLLDFVPRVSSHDEKIADEEIPARSFFLDPRGGTRKTTGSYYTNPNLIDALINSALRCVVEQRLSRATEKEKALLSIKVCDPACGSGAFLIAANNYLATELARLRTGQVEPADKEVRKARRDVLQHCIYGVDLNPMAVELAKVSLWINSCVEDMPLNFLDHHIKCGNSLIGATPDLLSKGVPDDAFIAVEGDDKDFAKYLRKRNSLERKQRLMDEFKTAEPIKWSKEYAGLNDSVEESAHDVEDKKMRFSSLVGSLGWKSQKLFADAWTAAFFWPLNDRGPKPPTQATLRIIQNEGQHAIDAETFKKIEELALRYRFFHWHLEFPDVFEKEVGGFDCILGNPPWERIKLQDKEFFSERRPEVTSLPASRRRQFIRDLPHSDSSLWDSYSQARRYSEMLFKYAKASGRFPLTSTGDINTYALFAEHAIKSIRSSGISGVIVPTGIATDNTNKNFFVDIVSNGKLVSLFDFENREGIFPEVHRLYKFCLLTTGNVAAFVPIFAFFLTNFDQMKEDERLFRLSAKEFKLLNPNTKTCPIFRTQQEANITIGIYRRVPALVDDENEYNPWGVYYMRLVHLADHADSIFTSDDLEQKGCLRDGRNYRKNGEIFLPLYESKLVHQFDHRFATFQGCSEDEVRTGYPRETSVAEHQDSNFETTPRYWIPEKLHSILLRKYVHDRRWLLVYRDVTGATNQRTAISTIIPCLPATVTLPAIGLSKPEKVPFLLANINSIVLDFVSRVKVSGMHLNFSVLKQLPIIPPDTYDCIDGRLRSRILECAIRLSYTSNSLRDFANEFGFDSSTAKWEETERTDLMCELNAIYSHLYGLEREELSYILDSFKALRDNETRRYGEFKTKVLTLKFYDRYSGKIEPVRIERDEYEAKTVKEVSQYP